MQYNMVSEGFVSHIYPFDEYRIGLFWLLGLDATRFEWRSNFQLRQICMFIGYCCMCFVYPVQEYICYPRLKLNIYIISSSLVAFYYIYIIL